MTSLRRSVLALATTAAALGAATLGLAPAAQADPLCGDTVTTSVVLTADLDCGDNPGTAALTVGADWITIDLGGHSIIGTGGLTSAIDIVGRTGVVVRGGTIDGASDPSAPDGPFGINVRDSSRITLNSLLVRDSGYSGWGYGIFVQDSSIVRITNVDSVRSASNGGTVQHSSNVVVSWSSFSHNLEDGLRVVDGSSKVQINDSRFDRNVQDGLEVNDSNAVQVNRTSASRNGQSGIEMNISTNARLYRVTAHVNDGDGVHLYYTTAQIQRSSLSYNGADGFYSTLSSFRISDSQLVDNYDDGLDADDAATFVIRRVRATLNGHIDGSTPDGSGIAVDNNVAGPPAYLIEYTVSNVNSDWGFEIDKWVTARMNSAAGNGTSNALPPTP